MPDEVKDTNQGDTQDTSAPPVPSVSDASSDAASAQTGTDVDSIVKRIDSLAEAVEKIGSELPKEVDRRFKQTTDPRFADVRKVASYLEAAGNDPELAAKNMLLDQMIEQHEQPQASSGDGGSSPAEDIQAETTKLLDNLKAELGVEFSREELESFSSSKAYTSNAEWYGELSTQAVKKAKSGNVGPAAVVGSSGAPVVSSDEQESLTNEMTDLYAGKWGSLSLPKNQKRLKEISAKLDEIAPPEHINA